MSWAARLTARPVPALHETHARLSRLIGRDDTSNWQIEDSLRRDPSLAMVILGDVNRQARRFGREEVTTFDSAIALLGRERLKNLVRAHPETCISLLDDLQKTGLRTAFGRALEAAQQAEDWALARREPVAEQYYHAALLSVMPEIALWYIEPELAAQAYRQSQLQDITLSEALSEVLAEDWNAICLELIQPWGLPEMLRDAWSQEPSARGHGIQLVARLLETVIHGWHTPQAKSLCPAIAAYLGMEEAQAWTRCERTAVHGATGLTALGLRPSAHTLTAADSQHWPLEQPLAVVGREPTPQPSPADPVTTLRAALQGLKGSNALLQQLLKHLRAELGLGRLVLMMLSQDKTRLEARFAVGLPATDPLRGLSLPLHGSDLFSALLTKHQPLWLDTNNRHAFLPHLPEDARHALADKDTFISPLQIEREPFGLLLAQRTEDMLPLGADEFRLFNAMQAVAHKALNPAP